MNKANSRRVAELRMFPFLLNQHEDGPLVEFMYPVFTRMPGESYRRRFRFLLFCLCDVFRALIDDLRKSRGLHSVTAFGRGPVYNRSMPAGGRIVQELCESRGGRLGLSVLTSFLVSVDLLNRASALVTTCP